MSDTSDTPHLAAQIHTPGNLSAATTRSALLLRPRPTADMPALVGEMPCEYPARGAVAKPHQPTRPGHLDWATG